MKTKLWWVLAGGLLFWLATNDVWAGGACTAARFHDWQDMGCSTLYAGTGSPPKAQCPDCTGMPRWWVSEPYINLCLADKPMSYTLSSGQELAFKFLYRQHVTLPTSDEVPTYASCVQPDEYPALMNCGNDAAWRHNWDMSMVLWDAGWQNDWSIRNMGNGRYLCTPPTNAVFADNAYEACVFHPEGGVEYFNVAVTQRDPSSQAVLKPVSVNPIMTNSPTPDGNNVFWGDDGNGVGMELAYPDGSTDVFGLVGWDFIITNTSRFYFSEEPPSIYSSVRLLLTKRIDPQGRVTKLGYAQIYPNIFPVYRLQYVVDPDGRTNQFHYTGSTNFVVSEIDDPYGRKTSLGYDGNGRLTSIQDAAGLVSQMGYSGVQVTMTANYASASNDLVMYYTYTTNAFSGVITNLSTRYGNTTFSYYQVDDSSVSNGVQQRAVYAAEPEGAQQLYYYLHKGYSANGSLLLSQYDEAPTVPGVTNFDTGYTGITHPTLEYRNSIHWGRRQFTALSTSVQNLLPGNMSNALAALSPNDFVKGRVRNWLWQTDNLSISESLASEREPSPDTAGLVEDTNRVWYSYPGQTTPEVVGTSPQIACIAQLLPDESSRYTTYQYYPTTGFLHPPVGAGLISNTASSYTSPNGGTAALVTWYGYATNSIDVASVSNSAGQYVNYGYNGNHQVIAETNGLNQVTTKSWDSTTHNLTGVQWPSGQNASFGYYSQATPPTATSSMLQWETIQPEGRSFTFNNYYAGLPTGVTDDRGVTLQNTWDGLNRLTSTVFPDTTTISNVYNRLDLVASKDRLNNWAYFAYDGLQHLTNVVNANGAATTYEWCGCGSLSEILDPQNGGNNPTSLNYDNQGNLLNVTLPDGSSRNWQYDLVGRMTNFVDGSGLRFLQVAYNNQGLPVTVTSANGTVQSAVYDALNRPVNVTDANGVTVTNTFDAINELVKRTWPDGLGEGFGYATNGLVAYTNRDGKSTVYGRDTAGRLTAETNANHEVTQFAYDSLDHITSLLDGNNHQTLWQYNQYGWLTNKLDGLSRISASFAYNLDGWVTNRWTPEKGNTAYTYDGVGNLKTILYPQSSIAYAYDGLNRLTNMVDLAGNHRFTWTPASQMASESDGWATNFWGYSQGLRIGLTNVEAGGNWTQTYNYDDGWRLQAVTSPAGDFGYNYNFGGASPLVTGISLPNGANIVNGYDNLARLRQTALNNDWGHALDSYTYTPDPLGLRTNIVRGLGLTTNTVNVGFDAIGQLTGWSASEPGGVLRQNEQLEFAYDAAHNLHTRTNGALAQTFTTDAANQLNTVARTGPLTLSGATPAPAASVTVNGQPAQIYGDFTFAGTNLALANGQNTIITNIAVNLHGLTVTNLLSVNLPSSVALLYDNNGNLTNDGARSFGYDCENQLTNVYVAGQWRSDFIYDGLNRRRIELDYLWQNNAWAVANATVFVYDGYELLQDRTTNGKVLVTYTRGVDASGTIQGAGGVGGLLARTDTNGSTFYHADGNGNITALIDSSENIVARYAYGPFGKLIGQWGTLASANEMQFSSMPRHGASGLSLYAFRAYDPNLQRWPNQDPIGERGGVNLYGFVRNDPINGVDPLGLLLTVAPAPTTWAGPYLNSPASLGGTAASAEGGGMSGGAAVATEAMEAFGAVAYSAAGGYLIGIALGLDRDAEAYPGGVNGVPQVWPGPMPAVSTPPAFQLTPFPQAASAPPQKPPCNNKTASGFPGENNERHHWLPREFNDWFSDAPRFLNIDDYTEDMPMQWHRGEDIGLHSQGYNDAWANFIEANPFASAEDTLQFMNQLKSSMGY